jgi:hypothetical protein
MTAAFSVKRGAILLGGPTQVAVAWAKALRATLADEGRVVEGGWPGTIVEARTLIGRHLQLELAARGMRHASGEELARATAATYARARAEWLGIERQSRTRRAVQPDPSRLPSR